MAEQPHVSLLDQPTFKTLRSVGTAALSLAASRLRAATRGKETRLNNPVGFISHTSDDNDFCNPFYTALRQNGVCPIMDEHDFRPGDDLVKRVFDEGIGESDAVLFVLSPASVDRPWVREELSAAVIRKLRDRTRLIPIVIKGLPDERVPEVLSATKWIRVAAEDDPAAIAKQVAGVLHSDAQPNPTVSAPPKWTEQPVSGKLGMDPRDEVLFGYVCRERLQSQNPLVATQGLISYASDHGLEHDDVATAISVFRRHYYIEELRGIGSMLPPAIRLTRMGLELYMRAYENERYERAMDEAVAAIVNDRASNLDELAAVVSEPSAALLELIIEILEAQGELVVVHSIGGPAAWKAHDSLRRRA